MSTNTLPATHRAGDTLSSTWSLSDYPATAGWALRLTLISAAQRYQASASASGADHVFTVAAATTAVWVPGAYYWTVDATKTTERYTVARGGIDVLPDLAAASTYDTRTPARKALEAAEAALATYGAQAYLQQIQFGDRRQQFQTPGDFLSFISRLRAQVRAEEQAERIAQGLQPRNRLLVRFTSR